MHGYSVNYLCNTQRVKKDGKAAIYLQVIINRVKKRLPLSLDWPISHIDIKKHILPTCNDDPDYHDYMMMINSQIARANEIFKLFRLHDTSVLTMPVFLKEFTTYNRRQDFMVYMENKIKSRFENNQISERTRDNNNTTLHKLHEFKTELSFAEMDENFFNNFKFFLKKRGNSHNTIWGNIKDIKTYLALASVEKISINTDHEKSKTGGTVGRIIYLDEMELKKVYSLFLSETLDDTHQQSLRAFLFQCFTSLRISDVFRANWQWVDNNNDMIFVPKKNERLEKPKEVVVPLGEVAMSLISKSRGLFFDLPREQTINEKLKNIAKQLAIRKKLTTHVGRHTFGTLYYKKTKDVLTLNKIMGHSKLEMTMIYVHINDTDKRLGVALFEDSFTMLTRNVLQVV